MTNYKSYIKNITTNEWVQEEGKGKVFHTANEDSRLVFSCEEDAESTLEYLNMNFSDAYVLLDASTEVEYLNDVEVADILQDKGYDFYDLGEFVPKKLSEIALKEGYEWEDGKGDSGWFFVE